MSHTKSRKTRQAESITGRDGYIVCQALGYAITCIERLPEDQQEWSNCEDMKYLLAHLASDLFDFYLNNAREHIDGKYQYEFDDSVAQLVQQ